MIGKLAQELGVAGRFAGRLGSAADYRRLARFHYTHGPPASFALVVAVDFVPIPGLPRPVAVGVLSYPTLRCASRERALQIGRVPRQWRYAYLNRHLRTISRVVVHPEFRGIGLASEIIGMLLRQSPTRYVETISRMARAHPLFARANMACVHAGDDDVPAYYLHDKLRGERHRAVVIFQA